MNSTRTLPVTEKDFNILATITSRKRNGILPNNFVIQYNNWISQIKLFFESEEVKWITYLEVEKLISSFEENDSIDIEIKKATLSRVWLSANIRQRNSLV